MTNLIDIYEAAGGEVNEDRSAVTIGPLRKPFKIELEVELDEIEVYFGEDGEPARATLLVRNTDDRITVPIDKVKLT